MRLNSPTLALFFVSVVLGVLAILTKLGIVPIPRFLPHQEFWLAITAYMVLMTGNVVRGL